ncbi:uncharacterized protein LOC143910676 [Arctopsyche grandis]|uniref:uncharacterized protein LOC143910676 n=1 Tax=Arctopsyche grandis TaxID=121162 RepID=UPI00406D6B45
MKILCAVCIFVAIVCTILPSEALECGEVDCPPEATTCSVKYTIANKPRRKINTVKCFNPFHKNVYTKTYETPLDVLSTAAPLPVVECGGYQCKEGAYNCTTITTPSLKKNPPQETTHLVCRDDEGEIIEERDIVRTLSVPEANGSTPPTCEGHKCPPGSRSCTYDTKIHLDPFKKTSHVTCFDIKKKKTSEVTLVL